MYFEYQSYYLLVHTSQRSVRSDTSQIGLMQGTHILQLFHIRCCTDGSIKVNGHVLLRPFSRVVIPVDDKVKEGKRCAQSFYVTSIGLWTVESWLLWICSRHT